MAGFFRTTSRAQAPNPRLGLITTPQARDPLFANVSLLLPMNGANGETTFRDFSANQYTVTRAGNVSIATASAMVGDSAATFDGTGDSLSVADATPLRINGGDYTVETWVRTTQSRQYATLVTKGNSNFTSGSWSLMLNSASASSGDVSVYHVLYSGISPLLVTSGVNIRDGNRHHVAWTRLGNFHAIWVDGALRASATQTFSGSTENTNPLTIGFDGNFSGRDLQGDMEQVRITKGVARYTRAFTRPALPFPRR